MTAVSEILAELHARGGAAYRYGDRVRMVPPSAVSPEILARVREHKAELLVVLPEAPPDVAALPATAPLASAADERGPWIISSSSDSDMRLIVASPPPWPDEVYRAGALVEVLDARHRADRADAQEIADDLEALLAALRAEGIKAWLAS